MTHIVVWFGGLVYPIFWNPPKSLTLDLLFQKNMLITVFYNLVSHDPNARVKLKARRPYPAHPKF